MQVDAAVEREDELLRAHEMWRQAAQALALAHRLEHQADVALLEVAQPPVNQLRGAARGAGGEVGALDERGLEATQDGVAGDAGAVDAATDDQHVEGLAAEAGEDLAALGEHVRHLPRF